MGRRRPGEVNSRDGSGHGLAHRLASELRAGAAAPDERAKLKPQLFLGRLLLGDLPGHVSEAMARYGVLFTPRAVPGIAYLRGRLLNVIKEDYEFPPVPDGQKYATHDPDTVLQPLRISELSSLSTTIEALGIPVSTTPTISTARIGVDIAKTGEAAVDTTKVLFDEQSLIRGFSALETGDDIGQIVLGRIGPSKRLTRTMLAAELAEVIEPVQWLAPLQIVQLHEGHL